MKIYDKDGNGTIDANDKMILGHCAPTWTGNFTSNLSYKNIDFSFSIYTSQGGMVYSPFMSAHMFLTMFFISTSLSFGWKFIS